MKSCNLQRSFFAMDFSCSSLCCCCCFCRPTNTVQIKSNSTTRSRDASRSWLLAVLSTQIQLRKNTMNDNQNVFHRGRSSSRVLAPPGGVCSITIGVAPAPPQPKAAEEPDVTAPPTQVMSQAVAVPEPPKVEATTKPETTKPVIAINKPVEQPVSANLFAAGARANGANVMTGRPTSRVLAPPGGHCQITLG